jgi:hypothetical protein
MLFPIKQIFAQHKTLVVNMNDDLILWQQQKPIYNIFMTSKW